MTRSAVRARRWSLTTASFAADLALFIVIGLMIWLVLPALFLGWTPVMISSGSMSPAIEPGDLVLLDPEVPEDEWYVPGTIVAFEESLGGGAGGSDSQTEKDETRLITHRVERFETAGAYITRGDANAAADPRPVEPQQVVGAARLLIPWLGLPVHWARSGQFLNLAVLLAALLGCVAVSTRELAVRRAIAGEEVAAGEVDERAVGEAQADPIDAGASGPVDDVGALGARAARAARAAGKSALAVQEARDQERRQQPDRKDVGIPPASAMLLVVALTGGIWASASAQPSQAAFAASGGSTGNTFAMAPASDVTAETNIYDDWGTGYCAEVTVSTTSTTPITWDIEVDLSTYPLNGTITGAWNVTYEQVGPIVTATGAGWNNSVVAGAPRTWGFCADRPSPPTGSADYTVHIDTEWGTGYCATVTVSTPSPTPITWNVEVDLSTYPLNGTPYDTWNANTSFADGTLSASGVSGNSTVVAGSTAEWGYCANRSVGEIPSTSFVLPDLDGTGSISPPNQNSVVRRNYSFQIDGDLYLVGSPVAELLLRRTGPGNSPGYADVALLIDGEQVASGASGNLQGSNAWQLLTVPMSPTLTGPLSADSIVTFEVELYRVELQVGGPSSLILSGG